MDNKILVILSVPDLDETFDLKIPYSRKIGNIIELITKFLIEYTHDEYQDDVRRNLYNMTTGLRYNINELVANTDIKNGTNLILI